MPKFPLGDKPQKNLTPNQIRFPKNFDLCECGYTKTKGCKVCRKCWKQDKDKRTEVHSDVFYIDGESCRLIGLTQGKITTIWTCRYEEFSKLPWFANKQRSGWYAVRKDPKTHKSIRMHRQITGADSPEVDHHNHDTLDNRDSNLRPCTRTQNRA